MLLLATLASLGAGVHLHLWRKEGVRSGSLNYQSACRSLELLEDCAHVIHPGRGETLTLRELENMGKKGNTWGQFIKEYKTLT